MPVYTRTYRNYEGTFKRHARWLLIVEQEIRILVQGRMFKFLCFGAFLHWLIRLFQIVAHDVIIQDPNHPLAPLLVQWKFIIVNEELFFDFLRIQAAPVFLVSVLAGAGMICNDFRNNLMEVYFSKPITWRDYALGKILSLVTVGMAFTAIPALALVIMHNFLAPGLDTLTETAWWPLEIAVFSLLIVIPIAMGILACSAMMKSQNFAGITAVMIIVANTAMAELLAGFLQNPSYRICSIAVSVDRVGQAVFHQTRLVFDLSWTFPLCFIGSVTLICAIILARVIKGAECAS